MKLWVKAETKRLAMTGIGGARGEVVAAGLLWRSVLGDRVVVYVFSGGCVQLTLLSMAAVCNQLSHSSSWWSFETWTWNFGFLIFNLCLCLYNRRGCCFVQVLLRIQVCFSANQGPAIFQAMIDNHILINSCTILFCNRGKTMKCALSQSYALTFRMVVIWELLFTRSLISFHRSFYCKLQTIPTVSTILNKNLLQD